MQQIESLPIKNICFGKTWNSYNSELAFNQTGKYRNSKNFLFMRVIHQNNKNRKLSSHFEIPKEEENKEKLVRPRTSLLKYQNPEQFVGDQYVSLPKQNPEKAGNSNNLSPKRYHTPCNERSSQGLKNYFPQRKPKKNKDLKWHQYYTLMTMKQFTIQFIDNAPKQMQKPSLPRKNTEKTIIRNRTQKSEPKQMPRTPQKEMIKTQILQKYQNIQISPWYTPVMEGQKLHIPLQQH